MHSSTLDDQLEAILFVATEPLTIEHLAELTQASLDDITKALQILDAKFRGGIRLSRLDQTVCLVTAPSVTDTVRTFLRADAKAELSRPALETLAIIAYRGPITKGEIDRLRGVTSDIMVRNLLARGFIVEADKSDEPGRPWRYSVSHAFLQHFGLTSTADLPSLDSDKNESKS